MPDGVETGPQAPAPSLSQGFVMDTSSDAELVPGVTGPVRSSSSFAQTPAPTPTSAPTHSRTGPRVSFGDVVVHHLPSSSDDLTSTPVADSRTPGFGPLGSVGEMEAYEAQCLGWGASAQPRRPCAPISASRIVQRRWRANAAAGPR
jgi:hypothetical protein